ncbi:hypothetical protein KOAAANKH_02816 [Brevundimonas sp. NIBR10]|uniref:PulJ/GspJ family protein n=1 Tax=Brevundimonas sp. NIBR10 TaxID=3015997 RepID=UPI0022F1A231|nr:prepilin-type N-terminal cleavage/methylation domain-containing protein [Brevundimonas sp. NIBR10]WGM47930.1 hypothetical protein KOAAANKH_02816 [Brevundimonas sp. NIBR10]
MTQGHARKRAVANGFTLIELLVAMALFALISLAGFAMLSGIIRTQERLDGRLEQLAQLQRAMYLMTLDFESMTPAPVVITADSIAFQRAPAAAAGGTMAVRYGVKGRDLVRQAGAGGEQVLIRGVSGISLRFLDPAGAWVVPTPALALAAGLSPERPGAIEATLILAPDGGGLSGPLRRVVELPRLP